MSSNKVKFCINKSILKEKLKSNEASTLNRALKVNSHSRVVSLWGSENLLADKKRIMS